MLFTAPPDSQERLNSILDSPPYLIGTILAGNPNLRILDAKGNVMTHKIEILMGEKNILPTESFFAPQPPKYPHISPIFRPISPPNFGGGGKPEKKPNNPNFSSGPCAKRPGWKIDALKNSSVGRSHRSKECKETKTY